jgi:SET domain-containing protein
MPRDVVRDFMRLGDADAVVETRQSAIHGHGIFAKCRLRRNVVVTFYDGERIDWPEALERSATHMRSIHTFYEAIDGLRTPLSGRGMGSFANHSSKHANAAFHVRNDECFIKLTRDVDADEEILVNYGSGYWRRMQVA